MGQQLVIRGTFVNAINSQNEQDTKKQKLNFDEENVVKPFVYHDAERMVVFYR
jgi:hypothetical protein